MNASRNPLSAYGRRRTEEASFEVIDPERAGQQTRHAYDSAVRLFALLCLTYRLDSAAIISHTEGFGLEIASDHKDPEHLWEGLGMDLTMDRFHTDVKKATDAAPYPWFSGPPNKIIYPLWKRLRSFIFNH